jgi:hypothetical protein
MQPALSIEPSRAEVLFGDLVEHLTRTDAMLIRASFALDRGNLAAASRELDAALNFRWLEAVCDELSLADDDDLRADARRLEARWRELQTRWERAAHPPVKLDPGVPVYRVGGGGPWYGSAPEGASWTRAR